MWWQGKILSETKWLDNAWKLPTAGDARRSGTTKNNHKTHTQIHTNERARAQANWADSRSVASSLNERINGVVVEEKLKTIKTGKLVNYAGNPADNLKRQRQCQAVTRCDAPRWTWSNRKVTACQKALRSSVTFNG